MFDFNSFWHAHTPILSILIPAFTSFLLVLLGNHYLPFLPGPTLNSIKQLKELKNLRPTIYFSVSLKEQLKYVFGKNKLNSKPDRHKYLKTKTQFLLYRKDHEIKTNYNKKYDNKDLYTATLIPEYGSWIRFGFQKNTKINSN